MGDEWASAIGASPLVLSAMKYEIREMLTIPFTDGFVKAEVPQTRVQVFKKRIVEKIGD